jgi:hypothetical protein
MKGGMKNIRYTKGHEGDGDYLEIWCPYCESWYLSINGHRCW